MGDQTTQRTDNPPTVSIAVPIYNGERFLAQALDSLLGQSFQDFELIISDNASTDKTAAICQRYAARDARIRYIRQPMNIGAPRNWNFVAEQARGKYLKWSSANDFCDSRMLEKCVAEMESEEDVVLCYGRTCLVDEDSNVRTEYANDVCASDLRPSDRFTHLFRNLEMNNAQSGLIRIDTLRRTPLDRLYPHGDRVLMAELVLYGRFVLLPEVLLYRRMGRETASMQLDTTDLTAFFDPRARRSIRLDRLRLHFDYLVSVARARIDFTEKLRSLSLAVRHAFWERKLIWHELREQLGPRRPMSSPIR